MKPKIYEFDQHSIDHDLIDQDALYVVEKLKNAGYAAYIVGGSVRDLLINRTPKDFDISTSASPEDVKNLFHRQCILIGRRFRLAHIRFGHKVIELATFRAGENDDDLITQDNVWGTEEQDVLRRDFTINGLFYDPATRQVIDYVGGWEDIQKRMLRSIGDPITRFKQDPVRMIRLLKFQARFELAIDPATQQALDSYCQEIKKSSPARILEEFLRMLESGASQPFFKLCQDAGMLDLLFPPFAEYLRTKDGDQIYRFLSAADQMNNGAVRRPLDRSILTSCLLFPILEKEMKTEFLDRKHIPHLGEVILHTNTVIRNTILSSFSHFPRRISTLMSFILSTQYRLTPFGGRRHHPPRLFRNKDFPMALIFLKLRGIVDSQYLEVYGSWKEQYRQFMKQNERTGHHHHAPPDHPSPQKVSS